MMEARKMTILRLLCSNLHFEDYTLFSKYDHIFHYVLASRELYQSAAIEIHVTKSKQTPRLSSASFELKHCKLRLNATISRHRHYSIEHLGSCSIRTKRWYKKCSEFPMKSKPAMKPSQIW